MFHIIAKATKANFASQAALTITILQWPTTNVNWRKYGLMTIYGFIYKSIIQRQVPVVDMSLIFHIIEFPTFSNIRSKSNTQYTN
jgi:hypothetical protein